MAPKMPFNEAKLCLVGSETPYPAFDSVSSILKEILGTRNVTELRIKDWIGKCPSILKPLFSPLQDLRLCFRILSHCKRNETKAVLVFQGYYPLTCIGLKLAGMRLLLYIGGSGFYWSHLENTSTTGRVFVYANLPIEYVCHRFADMIITLSRSMVKIIRTEKYRNKTYFALPRLDKEFFREFRIIREHESRKNVVGLLGILVRRKGVSNFIEAIRIIERTKIDCGFIIVGGGPLLETVKAKVRSYGLENKVKVTGFVDYCHLVKCFNEMKLYVLPSYAEGVPSTIFEAMACGTPVLATPVGGIPDVIKEGENGFLLRSYEPKKIADRIIKLLENHELLGEVSMNAYNNVRKNFNEENIRESWQEIIGQLNRE